MPDRQPLTQDEFNAVVHNAIASAPAGLSPDEFENYIQQAAHRDEVAKAAAAGGTSVTDFSPTKIVGNFLGSLGDTVAAIPHAVMHPLDTTRALVTKQFVDEPVKAYQAAKEGDYSRAIGHAAASLVPIFGPAAADIGESAGEHGDINEAIGKGAALAATLPSVGGEAVSSLGRGVQTAGRLARIPARWGAMGEALHGSIPGAIAAPLIPRVLDATGRAIEWAGDKYAGGADVLPGPRADSLTALLGDVGETVADKARDIGRGAYESIRTDRYLNPERATYLNRFREAGGPISSEVPYRADGTLPAEGPENIAPEGPQPRPDSPIDPVHADYYDVDERGFPRRNVSEYFFGRRFVPSGEGLPPEFQKSEPIDVGGEPEPPRWTPRKPGELPPASFTPAGPSSAEAAAQSFIDRLNRGTRNLDRLGNMDPDVAQWRPNATAASLRSLLGDLPPDIAEHLRQTGRGGYLGDELPPEAPAGGGPPPEAPRPTAAPEPEPRTPPAAAAPEPEAPGPDIQIGKRYQTTHRTGSGVGRKPARVVGIDGDNVHVQFEAYGKPYARVVSPDDIFEEVPDTPKAGEAAAAPGAPGAGAGYVPKSLEALLDIPALRKLAQNPNVTPQDILAAGQDIDVGGLTPENAAARAEAAAELRARTGQGQQPPPSIQSMMRKPRRTPKPK